MMCAPRALRRWTAMIPTPPVAPETSTVSPCCSSTASTASWAAVPASPSAPAVAFMRVPFEVWGDSSGWLVEKAGAPAVLAHSSAHASSGRRGRAGGRGFGAEAVEQDVDQPLRCVAGRGVGAGDDTGVGLQDDEDVFRRGVGAERARGLGPFDELDQAAEGLLAQRLPVRGRRPGHPAQ